MAIGVFFIILAILLVIALPVGGVFSATSGEMTSGVIDFTNPTPTVNFTTTAASSSSDRSIEYGLTPDAGTTVEVEAPTNTTWNQNTNVLTIAKEMAADFTITVRVSGDAYSTAEYTVTINLDAT